MSLAIKIENLSKAYQLGEIGTGTLSRDIERWVAKLRGKEDPFLKIGEANDRTVKGESDIVWSLKDINLNIQQGDTVGIIGRNGAGKSTLLKLLSRVTSPTKGEIQIKGRIASLLEVGTGFHPELTGKENIYLNGAILGMKRKEIKKKFDEIVDFSGVERYVDTPVKRYSSGMYVRLAFAVAAHLESEILIVDEVLAVGDAEFQNKCLGKMGEISHGQGRTILFVSHNMISIQKLCKTGLLMENGMLISNDKMDVVVDRYLIKGTCAVSQREFKVDKSLIACILKVELTNENGELISEAIIGKKWIIKVYIQINKLVQNFVSAVGLMSPLGFPINTSWQKPLNLEPGIFVAEFKQYDVIFAIGSYKITVGLSVGGISVIQYIEDTIDLRIIPLIDQSNVSESLVKYDSNTSTILNQLSMKTYSV